MWRKVYAIALLAIWALPAAGGIYSETKIDSAEGRRIVDKLLSGSGPIDTTSFRKESKNVVRIGSCQSSFSSLTTANPHLAFSLRDEAPAGAENMTFTFYGRGIKFLNLGIPTKIKLRARFYLHRFEDGSLQRPEEFKELCFLEIKVKNPSPHAYGASSKVRIKIPDHLLTKLYRLNPSEDTYTDQLKSLQSEIHNVVSDKKAPQVDALFETIATLVKEDPMFAKPVFATSYTRVSKKYVEQKYKSKRTARKNKKFGKIEYQLTLDSRVKGYLPKMLSDESIDYLSYFINGAEKDCILTYPPGALVVEMKVPVRVTGLSSKRRSKTHRKIEAEFMQKVFRIPETYPGFQLGRGKAGAIRRSAEELAAGHTKNAG